MRLIRLSDGHYETDDGRYAVVRSTAGWFTAEVDAADRQHQHARVFSTLKMAAANLAFMLTLDSASDSRG